MNTRRAQGKSCVVDPFKSLRDVGPAARADLAVLGITNLEQLVASDPDHLYVELQARTARRHDPCVWDVFAAALAGEDSPLRPTTRVR